MTGGGCQQFYDYWRGPPASSEFRDTFPYTLGLGVDAILPFNSHDTSENRIVVTKSYDDMFHRLLRLRRRDYGRSKGAVLTGQPGIGTPL